MVLLRQAGNQQPLPSYTEYGLQKTNLAKDTQNTITGTPQQKQGNQNQSQNTPKQIPPINAS